MFRLNYFPRLIFTALIFLVGSCTPITQDTSYPNPLPLKTKTPLSTLSLDQTALPAPSFGEGYLAEVAINDVLNYSNEEVVKLLVSKWLESLKKEDSQEAIKNYRFDRVIIRNHDNSEVIATIFYYVQPIKYSSNWVSMSGSYTNDPENPNNPWWLIRTTFGVYRDGEYFKLKLLPGWGT